MNLTKEMIEEHKKIVKVADALTKEAELLIEGKSINTDFFEKATDFIVNYADKFHHAKEEDLLFKEFTKAAEEGCAHCNPVEQMLHEHNLGRGFVKAMKEAIKNNDKKKLAENALSYSSLIKEHIFKEDNILYPMAEESLNEKTKKSLSEKFKKINKQTQERVRAFIKFSETV